jgi:hypothetical protein
MDERVRARTVAVNRFGPAGVENARRWLWIALVATASIVSSLALACAMPFVGLATLAAVKMGRRDAVALVGVAWLTSQVLGYGVLGYPRTFDSYAWGAGLGSASLVALAGAQFVSASLRRMPVAVGTALAFLGAFVVYEAALLGISFLLGTGAEAFSARIVLWIFEVNAAAVVGLLALNRLGVRVGLVTSHAAAPTVATAG